MKKGRPPVAAAQNKAKKDTFTVEREDTLLAFLLARLPARGRTTLKAVLRDRQVFVDDRPVSQFDHALVPGSLVTVQWDREATRKPPTRSRLNIVFEDADLIVIDKPSGLLTVATDLEKRRTAYSQLSDHVKLEDPDNKIFVVHRLDRETSGLLLFAKNGRVKQQIQETWETTVSQRTYVGVVEGVVEPAEGTIVSYLAETTAFRVYSTANAQGGKKAITHYRKTGGNDRFSLLQINLETGRKHQIRVHMQDLGHPIVGDTLYATAEQQQLMPRLCLHAENLSFYHPQTEQLMEFYAPVPF